jgi:cytochrome c oxidase subunit 2
MSLKRLGIAAGAAALLTGWASTALALPVNWGLGFQAAESPVMENIEDFHKALLYIITVICIFVAALLVIVMVKFNRRSNPVPSKNHHNTILEVAWTIVPVIILVFVAVPSFRLLYFEATIPKPDVTIKAIGKQWFWSYEYPASNFQFDSLGLSESADTAAHEPRLLGVDNVIVIPVNKVIEIETTGADVIHSWALPQMGVKMDAVPGRLNHTWFKALHTGTFYGQCSELCGARHAFMPIEVRVVSDADYAAWLVTAKKKFASIDSAAPTRFAAK